MKEYICKEKMRDGKIRIKIIGKIGRERVRAEHVGVAHNEEELKMYLILARERLKDPRQSELNLYGEASKEELLITQNTAYSKYLYDKISEVYDKLKFNEIGDEIFRDLTIARIIEPGSKKDTIRVLSGLGLKAPTLKGIRCSLKRTQKEEYRGKLSKKCCEFIGLREGMLLLYDVTTLYFEIDKEDGYRKRGYSKERRLEPQIVIGLLVDKNGFPLAINSFEGNKAETKTLSPVLKAFKREKGIKEITVVADAGMLSADNLEMLEEEGFKFVVGSRRYKTPYEIAEYHYKGKETIKDKQTFDTMQKFGENKTERRVIYQYRQERAKLDNSNTDKQLKKAQEQKASNAKIKKAKFLKIINSKKEIDYEAVEAERQMAGIKGYVTNLTCDEQTVIDAYHNLFEVEKSFRMTKSDLQVRPVFHQTRESIEAHLTICFAALAMSRYIQDKTKLSIKKFVQKLGPIKTGVIQIGDKEYTARPRIDVEIEKIVNCLK